MRKSILGLSAVSLLALAAPAFAEDKPADDSDIKITGTVALVSDYRFRGVTQSGQNVAIQGGLTATSKSGFYVGTWASSINFAGSSEVDLFAGYSKEVAPGVTADVGVLYYLYPKHGAGATDFFEPYVNVTFAVGPATVKAGVNYAWAQSALGNLQTGTGDSDSIYLHVEPSFAIPNSPIALNGHFGYASSKSFMANPTLDYSNTKGDTIDWSVGATATYKMLTFGVSYVDTDVKPAARGVDGAVVFSLTAAF